MKVSIGILAWNEEEYISETIASLFGQSIFVDLATEGASFEMLCVPNGCTDATADRARASFAELPENLQSVDLKCSVCEIEEPGKVNAWNEYVHNLSDVAADYMFLVDADICINTKDTLLNMLRTLRDHSEACVSTDTPIKHIALKKRKSLADQISLAIAGTTQAAPGQLTGQLYCARAAEMRRIVIPKGVIVEDGFLKQMLTTNLLGAERDNGRIIRATDASHIFRAYTGLMDIFHNQVRQAVGHTVYTYLRDHLRERAACGESVEEILRLESERNPDWFFKIIAANSVESQRRWVVFPGASTVRFRRLRNLRGAKRLRALPSALAGFLLDIGIYVMANRRLKKGCVTGVWKDTHTKGMN